MYPIWSLKSAELGNVFAVGRFCGRTLLQQNAVSQTDGQTRLSELIYRILEKLVEVTIFKKKTPNNFQFLFLKMAKFRQEEKHRYISYQEQ
jgi:hypothetical protein